MRCTIRYKYRQILLYTCIQNDKCPSNEEELAYFCTQELTSCKFSRKNTGLSNKWNGDAKKESLLIFFAPEICLIRQFIQIQNLKNLPIPFERIYQNNLMKTFYCHATAGFPFTNPDHIYDRMRQRIPRQSSIKFT